MDVTTKRTWMLTTLWFLLDTALITNMETTGLSETHGELITEKMGTSDLREKLKHNVEMILLLWMELPAQDRMPLPLSVDSVLFFTIVPTP